MPNVRVLDFQKVKLKERVFAKKLFESDKGKQLIEDMINKKFHGEDNEEYIKALKSTISDEKQKQSILVLDLVYF